VDKIVRDQPTTQKRCARWNARRRVGRKKEAIEEGRRGELLPVEKTLLMRVARAKSGHHLRWSAQKDAALEQLDGREVAAI